MNRKYVTAASAGLFVLSLALPAVREVYLGDLSPKDPANIDWGLYLFALGWTGILTGIFAWLANPLYLAGLIFLFGKEPRRGRMPLTLAFILCLSTVSLTQTPFQGDAAGNRRLLVLMPGFFVWTGSILVAALASWLPARKELPRA